MDMQVLKLLIEALRTPSAGDTVTPRTGPDAGAVRPVGPPTLGASNLGSGLLGNAADAMAGHRARGL